MIHIMTDKQSILAYLGQAALLLRRRAVNKTTPHDEAEHLTAFAAEIQRPIRSIEERV